MNDRDALILGMLADYVHGNHFSDFVDWWDEAQDYETNPPSKEELEVFFEQWEKK